MKTLAPPTREEFNTNSILTLIPFVASTIDSPKITKISSRIIAGIIFCNYAHKAYKKIFGGKSENTEISIFDDSSLFGETIKWLSKIEPDYQESSFNLVENNDEKNKTTFDLVPSESCKVEICGVKIKIEIERVNRDSSNEKWAKDKIYFNIASKNKSKIKEIFQEIKRIGSDNKAYPITQIFSYSWTWRVIKKIFKQKSVILPNNEFNIALGNINRFLSNQEYYEEIGVPWRIGFLLHGETGSGKTSMVQAIATQLELDVYSLNLSSAKDDEYLLEAISTIPEKSILLLEDIDCSVFKNREIKIGKSEITFSGLLNAIDGSGATEGRITFMTTNHIKLLDRALIRPGRIDKMIEFGFATKEQIIDLAKKFDIGAEIAYNVANEWSQENICMAEVQNRFLDFIKD